MKIALRPTWRQGLALGALLGEGTYLRFLLDGKYARLHNGHLALALPDVPPPPLRLSLPGTDAPQQYLGRHFNLITDEFKTSWCVEFADRSPEPEKGHTTNAEIISQLTTIYSLEAGALQPTADPNLLRLDINVHVSKIDQVLAQLAPRPRENFTTSLGDLAHASQNNAKAALLVYSPWVDKEEGRLYFTLRNITAFLREFNNIYQRQGQITAALRRLGGARHGFNINGKYINVWWVPLSALPQEPKP